ncbi:uncharacterized protein LOC132754349 [Ruditapes philippinarum]|uniref:uncharacterized protein LOC132754349 n=1 Tax=Ruditapes philippinarum TaxID=129788 RepID=UPI00295C05CD|nr:uncharacterized protein LOC132754349 [Ruditapes philippinarum]
MIILTKLSVDINRSMLKKFFENAIECGGKIVKVTVNNRERSAIVTFDTSAAVYEMIEKRPLTILGFKIDVDVYRSDTLTEDPNMIILTKLSVDINRFMLKRFFENAIECGGKVVKVTVNTRECSAIVTFDTSAAVYEMMEKRPLTILGFKINVDVYSNCTVAKRNKDKIFRQDKIDGLWQSFVKKVKTPSSRSEQNRRKMIDIFRTSLLNEFKSHFAVLKGYLEQSQNLTPLPNVTFLRGTFHNTGINEKDINFTWFQTGKKILKGASNAMAYIQSRVDEVFGTIDDFIHGLCRVNEEITEMYVDLLMHELGTL